MKREMTAKEIETMLEERYLNRVISIEFPWQYQKQSAYTYAQQKAKATVSGKVDRISVEILDRCPEPIVVFIINHERYTADVNYFIQLTKLYGNPRGTAGGHTGVQKGD